MGGDEASKFIKEKRVTIIGLRKSAVDVAAEVATKNGGLLVVGCWLLLLFCMILKKKKKKKKKKSDEIWFLFSGVGHPCSLVFRRVHWLVPEHLNKFTFRNLNRFSRLMIHRPGEGFFLCLLAFLLSPLVSIFPNTRLISSWDKT